MKQGKENIGDDTIDKEITRHDMGRLRDIKEPVCGTESLLPSI